MILGGMYMGKVVFMLFILIGINYNIIASADIIKLKRGVSFEGKVLEEKDDMYIVELGVGLVEFKKDEVEEIEVYSDLENVEMIHEWDESVKFDDDISDRDNDDKKIDEDSLLNDDMARNDLIKYKGTYITPEVHKIIKRDQEVQNRRYKYLQTKKRSDDEKEKVDQKIDEIIEKKNENDSLSVEPAEKERLFGIKDTKKYGQDAKQKSVYTQKETFKAFKANKYGYSGDENTL